MSATPSKANGREVPVTREDVVKFTSLLLGRIVTNDVLGNAVRAALGDMGWPAEMVPQAPAPAVAPGTIVKGKAGKKKEPKENKTPRAVNPYQMFVTLVMDRIAKDPENPAYKVPQVLDSNGQPVKRTGGRMVVASASWSGLSDTSKQTFNHAFKPLCDLLNEESQRTGTKAEHLLPKLQEYMNKLAPDTKKAVLRVFEESLNALNAGKVAAAAPVGAASGPAAMEEDEVESSEEEGSSSEEEEEEAPKPAPKPAATPKQEDKKEKKEDKKKEKKDKKRKKEEEAAQKKKAKKQETSSSSGSDSDSE